MMSHEEREREHRMITSPDNWPIWPVLPLKRRTGAGLETGFLIGDPPKTGSWTVYIGNIFRRHAAIPRKYDDVEAILDDGWMVD